MMPTTSQWLVLVSTVLIAIAHLPLSQATSPRTCAPFIYDVKARAARVLAAPVRENRASAVVAIRTRFMNPHSLPAIYLGFFSVILGLRTTASLGETSYTPLEACNFIQHLNDNEGSIRCKGSRHGRPG